jgi:iron transport multicopper oxidase
MVRIDKGPFEQHVNPYYPMIGPPSLSSALFSAGNMSGAGEMHELHPSTLLLDRKLGATAILVLRTFNNMHHPMHIPGHVFEVLDQYSVNIFGCFLTYRYTVEKLEILKNMPFMGLLKDTVVMPAEGAVVIRFQVNNPGAWFARCHIVLHKEDGMAFII